MSPVRPVKVFTEQDEQVAPPNGATHDTGVLVGDRPDPPRARLDAGIASQLGTTWNTVWAAIRPLLKAMADDQSRLGVS